MAEVKVGDRTVTIPRFTGFKVVRAGRVMKEIAKKYPAIMFDLAAFTREYEDKNSIRITRAMAKTPRFQEYGFGQRDFDEQGYVELPVSPSVPEQVFAVFPQIMDAAEGEVVELLALILAPNSELAEADEDGTIDEYLAKASKKLLHEADADQLVDVAIVAADLLREQFAHKFDTAGNALASLIQGGSDATTQKPQNSPESSIDSPTSSNGEDPTHSIEQVGSS